MKAEEKRAAELALQKRTNGNGVNGHENGAAVAGEEDDSRTIMLWVGGIIIGICAMSLGIVWALLKLYPE